MPPPRWFRCCSDGGDVLDLSRREFLGLGRGAAAAAILAGLGLASIPRDAKAVVGIDDALLGAVVVAVASLGGYAMYNQFSGNLGLQAVGASFGNWIQSAPNRTAAAALAAQVAASYGLATTQERFSAAADAIASGSGAFADAMAAASESGRLALDGLVSGTGDMVGAFRELVAGYLGSGALADVPQTLPGLTGFGPNSVTISYPVQVWDWQAMRMLCGATEPSINVTWAALRRGGSWGTIGADNGYLFAGDGQITYVNQTSVNWSFGVDGTTQYTTVKRNAQGFYANGWERISGSVNFFSNELPGVVTADIVRGPLLPAVDKPADVPDVIGAGWDSVPLATDMVISPTTGEVVSAGSIALPTGIPTTAGDYAAALQGALAGVATDAIALPLSLSAPVTVATPLGVASMPLADAISTETSLQLDYAPDIPISPVLPPVDVPEGPWTPAVDLPFANVWPFNMIYTFVDTLRGLG